MHRLIRILLIMLAVLPFAAARGAGKATEPRDFVVVIDPGHGGKDYGAIGRVTNEKTINLDVGKRVSKLLENYTGLKVVMTRSTDVFLTLQQRADVANKANGDLFMSIHVNSVDKRSKNRDTVKGASVYTLGLHRSNANFEVAKRENSVIELEPDYSATYQGFDPNSTESYIIFELSQNLHLSQSIDFAQLAQRELTTTAGRTNRGVLQAGFWVLLASAMPSVLVELDFICNPQMESFLHSAKGKDRMARSLANAIIEYARANGATIAQKSGHTSEPESADDVADDDSAEEVADEAPAVAADEPAAAKAPAPGQLVYRVQFLACDRQLPAKSGQFKGLTDVDHYKQGGLYKYTSGGDFATEAEAEKYLRSKVKKLFPQAFIIKMKDGQRVQ